MDIQLFVPCHVAQFQPEIALQAVQLLEKLGTRVLVSSKQRCCGQTAYRSGYEYEARKMAEEFLKYTEGEDPIVSLSESCSAYIQEHFSQVFTKHQTKKIRYATLLSKRMVSLAQFIVEQLDLSALEVCFNHRVTLHDSCTLHKTHPAQEQIRQLLSCIEDMELVEMEEPYKGCGSGGLVSINYPELAGSMAETVVYNALKTGAQYIVCVESSCMMHLNRAIKNIGADIQTIHYVTLLSQPLR